MNIQQLAPRTSEAVISK